ncbi:acyltransferase [Vagococcus lutrae]|uniref:acyltransferase n=1 Tax=Vagococcus lutrae TaxID=81947 RepID=UPI002A7F1349|nr:acyltransferase [Vagococcus lutrae]MDY3706234.1 acyltransferase [Vagococcus lutrae]
MSSGRDKFYKRKKIILFLSKGFKIIPSNLRKFIWKLFYNSDTKVAILIRYLIIKVEADFCGDNVYVSKNVVLKNISNLSIGSNVSIHEFCYVDAIGGLEIGNNVSIAHSTSLITFNHTYENKNLPIKYNPLSFKKIVISNDVWIGAGVRILAGSILNEHCIVAAGAVVNKELESGYIHGGIPTKKIKKMGD